MNKDNRKELARAIEMFNDAKAIIEDIRDQEQDKFDNLSEGLQASEKGQKFEENVSTLDDQISNLEDLINELENL